MKVVDGHELPSPISALERYSWALVGFYDVPFSWRRRDGKILCLDGKGLQCGVLLPTSLERWLLVNFAKETV